MSASASYVSGIIVNDGSALPYRRLIEDIRAATDLNLQNLSKLLGIPSVQIAIVLSDESCRFANRRYERNVEIAWDVINGRYDGNTCRGFGLADDIKQAIVASDDRKVINGSAISQWEMIEIDDGCDDGEASKS